MSVMETEEFIRSLARSAGPVRRLAHPVRRAMVWAVVSVAYAGIFVWVVGARPDIADKLADPRFLIEGGAAFFTSMMAATAAFCSGFPGRPLWERLMPFPFLAVWLASLGEGCSRQWTQAGLDGVPLQVDLGCFTSILMASSLPALVIFVMIRRAAPFTPMVTAGLATLAASALGAAALRLFHPQDASLMLLVWQLGSVALIAGFGTFTGRRILQWSPPHAEARRG